MYEAMPLVNGFPGKTDTHGSFGWSSVWLLIGHERVILVETGPPSYLPLLLDSLNSHGLSPGDVTDVLITHGHWDHLGNVSMFEAARRWIGRSEYEWAKGQSVLAPFVSQPLLAALEKPTGLLELIDGGEVLSGIRAHPVPGHTPGHLAFEAETSDGPLLFVGDAAKNLTELTTLANDSALDMARGAQSLGWINDVAESKSMTVVPGHDVACSIVDGRWQRKLDQTARLDFFSGYDPNPVQITVSDSVPGWVSINADAPVTRRAENTRPLSTKTAEQL